MAQKTVLVITDGIGHNSSEKFNAFKMAKKPTYDWLFKNVPNTLVKTSGLAVGLPDGQMGNSEVGHMSIGSGRIIYQNLVKIDMAIKNGDFEKNEKILNLCKKCKNIHVVGLYSDGGVHSHLSHFDSFCKIISQNGSNAYAHIITDGRDVAPTSGVKFVKIAQEKLNIATICGRFYAMDRDNRFQRVKQAYDAYFDGANHQNTLPSDYILSSYQDDITDEFIKPASFNNFKGINEDDGVIFINFRNDRMKELVSAFGVDDFNEFDRKILLKNIITMTEYDSKFNFEILIKKENLQNTLPEVIANSNKTQFHTSETEKYPHVTFFFNGGVEDVLPNETRLLIPSPKVDTYDKEPKMSAYEVCDAVTKAMDKGFDFIVVNFANGDMVGHTGNYEASIKAVESVDECLGKIVLKAQELNYAYVQTSDHGNCEQMRDDEDNMLTNHTTFDVYCFVMAEGVKNLKCNSGLHNIAPTVLKLMGLEIPKQMSQALF